MCTVASICLHGRMLLAKKKFPFLFSHATDWTRETITVCTLTKAALLLMEKNKIPHDKFYIFEAAVWLNSHLSVCVISHEQPSESRSSGRAQREVHPISYTKESLAAGHTHIPNLLWHDTLNLHAHRMHSMQNWTTQLKCNKMTGNLRKIQEWEIFIFII